jgi:hypothetical protein
MVSILDLYSESVGFSIGLEIGSLHFYAVSRTPFKAAVGKTLLAMLTSLTI